VLYPLRADQTEVGALAGLRRFAVRNWDGLCVWDPIVSREGMPVGTYSAGAQPARSLDGPGPIDHHGADHLVEMRDGRVQVIRTSATNPSSS